MAIAPQNHRRTYHSALRDLKAETTRNKILEAAKVLFVEQGYKETSINAIASSAGVAPQTVYAAFGSKSGIILGIIRNIRENKQFRARYMETQKTGDTVLLIREVVTISKEVHSTHNVLFDSLFDAIGSSPKLREQLHLEFREERKLMSGCIEQLQEWGTLRPDLGKEEALDILWTLTSGIIYMRLVISSQWTHERYAQWLEELLLRELTTCSPCPK